MKAAKVCAQLVDVKSDRMPIDNVRWKLEMCYST